MSHEILETADGAKTCILWVSKTTWISFDDNTTLVLSGKAFLHAKMRNALNIGLTPRKPLEEFQYAVGNSFPSQKVQFFCNDIPKEWPCQERADKCWSILEAIIGEVMISSYNIKEAHDLSIFTSVRKVREMCLTSQLFMLDHVGKQFYCIGKDSYYKTGKEFCRRFFHCVDRAFEALTEYMKESKICRAKYAWSNDTSSISYGTRTQSTTVMEFVQKNQSLVIPYHFILECALKQPFLTPRRPSDIFQSGPQRDNFMLCERRAHNIIKSLRIFPSCHDFVAACKKLFRCLDTKSVCVSNSLGTEVEEGYLINKHVSLDAMYSMIHLVRNIL